MVRKETGMNVQSRNHSASPYGEQGLTRFNIFGINVVNAEAETAIRKLDEALGRGRRIKLAFLNAHGSNLAARDRDFAACLNRFTVFNDGVGVNFAARLLCGRAFRANLNGTDFVPLYLRRTRHQFRIFLLGAKPGIAERAAAAMGGRIARHQIVGAHHGYFGAGDVPAVLEKIRASGADLLLVALGNPEQEKFVERHFSAFNCEAVICVGALFDFMAGAVPRAPKLVRRLNLEWAFRLAVEPRRLWRRYLVGNAVFLARIARRRLVEPRRQSAAPMTHPQPDLPF